MVLGEDGFKLSKSRDNIIAPETLVVEYGADAFRQWGAMGAATGQDIMFNWNDVVAASRFQTKMWNIVRFVLTQIEREPVEDGPVTAVLDRWLLAKLSETVAEVTNALDTYQFDQGLRAIRDFTRNILADDYIELVKGRLYSDDAKRASPCRALPPSRHLLPRLAA